MARRQKAHKVKLPNNKTITVKSSYERKVAEALIKGGHSFEYEKESFKWLERVPRAYCPECAHKGALVERSYTPDFFLANGVIVETKGKFTAKDRKIAAAMKEQWGNKEVRMLFSTDNWITKQHKSRYSDWCTSKGIKWAIGEVPQEWLDE